MPFSLWTLSFSVFTREANLFYQLNEFLVMFNKRYKNDPTNLVLNQNIDDSITPYMANKYYISHFENEIINQLVSAFNSYYYSLYIIRIQKEKIFDKKK